MTHTPKLIIIRGNSGSGKSTVAKKLRELSDRKIALVGQDNVRRDILKEKETDDGANIALIAQIAEFALNHGYDVILEGILKSHRYSDMLESLSELSSEIHAYYFDISLEETLRRHTTKPNAHEFGEKELKEWYVHRDLIQFKEEKIIPEEYTFDQTVSLIMKDAEL